MLFKNVTAQKFPVYAYDKTTGLPKTGDAGNITGCYSLDGGAAQALTGNPSEIGGGWYVFSPTQAQTNGDLVVWYGASSTSNVVVEGGAAFTQAGTIPKVSAGSSGGLPLQGGVALAADQAVNVTKWNGTAVDADSIPTANQIADAVLARNVSNVEAAATRTSLATLVLATTNKANTKAHAGQLTVYRTNGATEHTQIPISTDPNADPIDGIGG